ncbi:preprotein translocase subunit SecG [Candidatus Pantoea edessiphila]|uniref:Protein-export membrane protein SecG n=1 Tax=Candidatus Pantoea edessiphila TaxID=2044610 RepID=A0A2P5T051_9GAMM|nr:preprotein translocase subunit SecG [Candidatus Pantoea edessiphila]PPI87930.1 preprotein translocase subunit SecG [Candidatus Pantoea edessiphila]
MYLSLLIFFFTISITFISLVMFQQSKGAGIETSFNSSTSDIIFNSITSNSSLNKVISILAALFFLISLILSNWNSNNILSKNEWENLSAPVKSQNIKIHHSSIKK